MQQDKTSNLTFFQWNEFGPSAGLTAGLGSVRVTLSWITLRVSCLKYLQNKGSKQYFTKALIRKIRVHIFHIPLKFVMSLHSAAVKRHTKFQCDIKKYYIKSCRIMISWDQWLRGLPFLAQCLVSMWRDQYYIQYIIHNEMTLNKEVDFSPVW